MVLKCGDVLRRIWDPRISLQSDQTTCTTSSSLHFTLPLGCEDREISQILHLREWLIRGSAERVDEPVQQAHTHAQHTYTNLVQSSSQEGKNPGMKI
eukprot:5830527-Amphidinium_carterae.1